MHKHFFVVSTTRWNDDFTSKCAWSGLLKYLEIYRLSGDVLTGKLGLGTCNVSITSLSMRCVLITSFSELFGKAVFTPPSNWNVLQVVQKKFFFRITKEFVSENRNFYSIRTTTSGRYNEEISILYELKKLQEMIFMCLCLTNYKSI